MEGTSATTVLADVAVVLLAGVALTPLRTRLRQPVVIGEVAVGVLLGHGVLGLLPGDPTERLFPPAARAHLSVIAQLGIALFMFAAGWELDLRRLAGRVRTVLAVTTASVALPFALAAAVAAVLLARHPALAGPAATPALFTVFLGIALSASALTVLTRIVEENRLQADGTGALAVACGALTETALWCAVAALSAATHGAADGGLPLALARIAGYAAALALVVRPLLRRLLRGPAQRALAHHPLLVLLAVASGALLSAWAASLLGLHAVIGAFAFGLAMPRDTGEELRQAVRLPLRNAGALLVPVFFALTGLSVDLHGLGTGGLLAAVVLLGIAWGGKFAGALFAARLTGVPRREAATVAVLLNTKGLGEVLILTLGRDLGIIGERFFTILLLTALAATLPVNPLIHRLTGRAPVPAPRPLLEAPASAPAPAPGTPGG
ncbi:cation:proton antiporter [Kitasatospora sp. NPDC096077]|uniref:cation:proton antiporter n=1 Tax=Kitasatospora sp. NPDC096077 TaxID=3155544 RepID=UPI00332BA1DB